MGKLFITGGQRLWDDRAWGGGVGTTEVLSYWNDTVGAEDYVYVLGDFSFGCVKRTRQFINHLNGREIVLLSTTMPTGESIFPPGARLGLSATGGQVHVVNSLVYITTGNRRDTSPTGRNTYYKACLHRYPLADWHGRGEGTLAFCLYGDTDGFAPFDVPLAVGKWDNMWSMEYNILPRVIS